MLSFCCQNTRTHIFTLSQSNRGIRLQAFRDRQPTCLHASQSFSPFVFHQVPPRYQEPEKNWQKKHRHSVPRTRLPLPISFVMNFMDLMSKSILATLRAS